VRLVAIMCVLGCLLARAASAPAPNQGPFSNLVGLDPRFDARTLLTQGALLRPPASSAALVRASTLLVLAAAGLVVASAVPLPPLDLALR
jgi:hypothetical protein